MNWINTVQDMNKWQAVVDKRTNLWVLSVITTMTRMMTMSFIKQQMIYLLTHHYCDCLSMQWYVTSGIREIIDLIPLKWLFFKINKPEKVKSSLCWSMHMEEWRYSSQTLSFSISWRWVYICVPLPLHCGKRAPGNYWNNTVIVKPNTA